MQRFPGAKLVVSPVPSDVTPKVHECGKCSKSFSCASKLKRHEPSHSNTLPFQCGVAGCNYSCKASKTLKMHNSSSHVSFSCHCGAKFVRKSSYIRHLDKHKTDTPDIFKCLHIGCLETFSVPLELTQHMKQHMPMTVCGVPDCSFTSKSNFDLKLHRKNEHCLWMLNCQLCGQGFAWAKNFRRHMENHTTEAEPVEFKCMKIGCQETFTSGADLKEHIESHDKISVRVNLIPNSEPPATDECEFCGDEIFEDANALKLHEGKHETETPGVIKCLFRQCKLTFTSATDLKTHAAKHLDSTTEERPFVCDFPDCNHASKRKGDLLRHKKVVHSADSWNCHICDKKFKSICYVTRHIKKQHD